MSLMSLTTIVPVIVCACECWHIYIHAYFRYRNGGWCNDVVAVVAVNGSQQSKYPEPDTLRLSLIPSA